MEKYVQRYEEAVINISKMAQKRSEYHKIDMNKYPNIFGCHIMYRTVIQIYLDATFKVIQGEVMANFKHDYRPCCY